jgi:Fe-S-cluster containining protein
MTPLENYRRLLDKVDAKFSEIHARHRAHMRCGAGCSTCCMAGLTVSGIEAANIRERLASDAAMRGRVEREAGQGGAMGCGFLDGGGGCTIYEVRPVVCRSHGVPLALKLDSGKSAWRQYCPLNFEGLDVEALPEGDTINLDTLNTLLSLINRQLSDDAAGERLPLTPAALMP